MKRLGMNDSDILEAAGWRSVEMLRRYTAAVAEELAQQAHRRYSPGDALKMGAKPPTGRTQHNADVRAALARMHTRTWRESRRERSDPCAFQGLSCFH
jgi:hypothetical protein